MQKLLRRSLIALAICLGAVLVCYFWIDRPTAFFVDRHHLDQVKVFHWLTYAPAGTPDLVAADPDGAGVAASLGTVVAVAEGIICRIR